MEDFINVIKRDSQVQRRIKDILDKYNSKTLCCCILYS